MSSVEDRLRDALRERAERSPVDPDAWAHVRERARRRRFWPGGPGRPARYVIPAMAAVAVAGIAIAASLPAGRAPVPAGAPAGSGPAVKGSVPAPAGNLPASGGAGKGSVPIPISQVVSRVSPLTGYRFTTAGERLWSYFWLGRWKPFWYDAVRQGLQLCTVTFTMPRGQVPEFGSSDPDLPPTVSAGLAGCQPVPLLRGGQSVRVTDGWNAGGESDIRGLSLREGIAAGQVASVTAVLPDGRSLPGAVRAARGLRDKVWSVAYPPGGMVRLVFRDAAGREVSSLLGPPVPAWPALFPPVRPASGGVRVFEAARATPPVSVYAYLLDGRVGFWSQGDWAISPYPADFGPALAGLLVGFGQVGIPGHAIANPGAGVGYARADVARVVLRIPYPGGFTQVTTSTFAAGWPGTDIRLWAFPWPLNAFLNGFGTATGYDAAGHVVAVVQLGSRA